MSKTRPTKIESLSTADWQHYHQLLASHSLMTQFADEIVRFSRTPLKPDEVLRRFSLNGDGQLDLKEFQLAMKRLEIVVVPRGDGGERDRQQSADERARALYHAFCPMQSRKLDIDVFCKIMTEWSLQLMRAQYQQSQQQRSTRGNRAGLSSAPSTLATPYATESSAPGSRGANTNDESGMLRPHLSEAEAIWRRITTCVIQNSEKLRQIFLRLDITCSGSVTQEEFELALSHIGLFLTPREFDRLYESLDDELKLFRGDSDVFDIKYTGFLDIFKGPSSQPRALRSTSKQVSPPVVSVGNARLWDMLVASLDKLQALFKQYQRIQKLVLSPESFRDCLRQCGIVLSNADYAALRVQLLPYTDSASGNIRLTSLLEALKLADHTSSQSRTSSSPYLSASTSRAGAASDNAAFRTGRKTVFTPASQESPRLSATFAAHAAGKSNEQRNAEAERPMVRIRDESRWRSDLNFPESNSKRNPAPDNQQREQFQQHQQHQSDPFFASGKPPPPLEERILTKLQQAKELGQLGVCSQQTIFPGDRFGRITRGQFRQSLVHLGVLARYAEVEALFWTLDPTGKGYMVNHELYEYLNAFAARRPSELTSPKNTWNKLTIVSDSANTSTGQRLTRSVQKVIERMLLDFPAFLAICEHIDVDQKGTVSPPELLSAIQELGILASVEDTQTAISALCQGLQVSGDVDFDKSTLAIPYRSLDVRLSQLCSDLLSPRKRKKNHLSTASVLLAPQEQLYNERLGSKHEFDMNTVSETDALWNCPRRRMNQSHRANKTSIQITDELPGDGRRYYAATQRPVEETKAERLERMRRVVLISMLQDLLERRSDLKTVMDLHRKSDVHGQVTKQDLVDILMTSRLNLNFGAGVSAREFVDELYPSLPPTNSVGFLDLLHRCGDLLADATRLLQASRAGMSAVPSEKQQKRQAARKLNSTVAFGSDPTTAALPPTYSSVPTRQSGMKMVGDSSTTLLDSNDEDSVRTKLLRQSRLKDLLMTPHGRQSAAILVRHAFKGLSSRDMVVPVENGQYEAMCRTDDLKHVCYRLGLDLDPSEQQFVAQTIDTNGSGFVSSPQVLEFFVHLAKTSTLSHDGSVSKYGKEEEGWMRPVGEATTLSPSA